MELKKRTKQKSKRAVQKKAAKASGGQGNVRSPLGKKSKTGLARKRSIAPTRAKAHRRAGPKKQRGKTRRETTAAGQTALDRILRALRNLRATGPVGFEGVIRDFLEQLTHQKFRLQKSGVQAGVDGASDTFGNGLAIGFEGKRFRTKNLELDELKAKLHDAMDSWPELDLWLLAATAELSATTRKQLVDIGATGGVAVEILDWPATSLPDLVVLIAHNPRLATKHLGQEVALEIKAVRTDPTYPARLKALKTRLTGADLGYMAACQALADWQRSAMRSLPESKALLAGYTNVLDPEVKRVARKHVNEQLSAWMDASASERQLLALIGDEGVGKTWAACAWWHERATDSAPLFIMLSARSLDPSRNILDEIASVLAKRIALRDPHFWHRRVLRWLTGAMSNAPRVLLLVDGLNENWRFKDWTSFLQPLYSETYRRRVAVIVTCWPDYWKSELLSLANLHPPLCEVWVKRLNDAELNELLARYDVDRAQFDPAVLDLMRVPRLFHLAMTHRSALAAASDVTRERLVYEDWKERLKRRGNNLVFTDAEFQGFIAELGRKVRGEYTAAVTSAATDDSHSRRELLELIGRDSGRSDDRVASTLDEIIAGRWLESTGKPNKFHLRRDLAPFALGLALVSDLKMLDEQERRQTLSKLMDDLRGQSLGTDILRSAVTVSLLDSDCSAAFRRELLVRWTSEQNFSNAHFQSYWRLIALDPDAHFDAIDAVWSACSSTSQQDEIFVHGTTLAAEQSPAVLKKLSERLTDWLGTYWLDRFEGAVLNYDEHAASANQRRTETAARVHAWKAAGISLVSGTTRVTESDNGKGAFWRNKRAVAWLSHLDRTPFSEAIASWAIAGALMGMHHFSAEIGWVFRMNLRDHEESSRRVQTMAMAFLSTKNEVARVAAQALLKALALASVSSPALHAEIASRKATVVGATNPLDPASPPVDQRARVETLSEHISQNKVWNQQGPTREDIEFETSTAELARWAPNELAQLLRSLLAGLRQSGRQAIEHRATELPMYLPLLSSAELLELKSLRIQLSNDGVAGDSGAMQSLLFSSLLNATAASEQIRELKGLPHSPVLSEENAKILAIPAEHDFKLLRTELLVENPTERLRCWLGYLKSVSLENMPDDLFELVELTNHADAQVREMALDVLIDCDRPGLLKRFSESIGSLPVNVTELEALKRGMALCESTKYDSHALDRLRGHTQDELLPYLCSLYPNDPCIVEEFSDFVRRRLQLLSSDEHPRSLKNYRLGGKAPIEALIKSRFEDIVKWLQPVIAGDVPLVAGSIFFEPYPLLEVCEALLRQRPEVGVRLWHRAMDALRGDVFQISTVQTMLFTVPNSPAISDARCSVIERAKTDRELQSIVLSCLKSGEEGWVQSRIRQDIRSSIPGLVARGLTMAGMLDVSDDAALLWSELTEPSGSEWLSFVWRDARKDYYRNVWARHWFDRYLSAPDPIHQIAYCHLFSECADERAVHWASLIYNSVRASLSEVHARHLRAVWPKLVRRIDRNSKNKLSKELMHTKALSSLFWPWS